MNPIVQFDGSLPIWGQKKPTSLDRVGVRRLLMYLEKKLRALYRCALSSWGNSQDWMRERIEDELFWLAECKGIYDFELAVGEYSTLVAVQPKQGFDWIYIELEGSNDQCMQE